MTTRRVCVFSGSRPGVRPSYMAAARSLGDLLAKRRWPLVYGGSSVGLMGGVADAVLAAKGEAIGVIPEALVAKEIAHGTLTDLIVVKTMHERKAKMAELADAFMAIPGGFGTFDELFEIVTWAMLGLHQKPIVLLDTDGYFRPLVAMTDHAIAEGFVPEDHRALFLVRETPELALDAILEFVPPVLGRKWIDEKDT